MKITIDQVNDAVHLLAKNEDGNEVHMDGSEKIGGEGKGARPMQVVLMALGGCSTMDVLSILKKMKQNITEYSVEVDGVREDGEVPNLFKDINVRYFIDGKDLDEERVKRAVKLSMEKYCSVTKILEKTATVTYDVILNGEAV